MELAREAANRDVQVLIGEALAGTQQEREGRALGPLRAPLQAVADRCRHHGEAETRRVLGPHARLLGLYEPSLLELPGLDELPEPAELTPEAARLRLHEALHQTLLAFAGSEPLLLILDDLQWADELTLGFVQFLLQAPPETARPRSFSAPIAATSCASRYATARRLQRGTGPGGPAARAPGGAVHRLDDSGHAGSRRTRAALQPLSGQPVARATPSSSPST
jgi:hypothetical protein